LLKSRASLKTFLQTGSLGPVSLGMSLKDVSDCLGPPRYWANIYDKCPVPCFWGYQHLEMRFSHRAPYRLLHVQLSRADELRGKSLALSRNLRLSLDTLHSAMKPSEFLRQDIWPKDRIAVNVQLISGELQLRLDSRPNQLLYVMYDDDIGDYDGLIAAFHRRDWRSLATAFEQVGWLRNIECYSPEGWRQDRHWNTPLIEIDGQTYLDYAAEVADAGGSDGGSER